jgi:hypothetical protein
LPYGQKGRTEQTLTSVTKLTDMKERTGTLGKILFMTTDTLLYNAQGKLAAIERDTGITY